MFQLVFLVRRVKLPPQAVISRLPYNLNREHSFSGSAFPENGSLKKTFSEKWRLLHSFYLFFKPKSILSLYSGM